MTKHVEVVVVRGRSESSKYRLNPEAKGGIKLPQQANDVYRAITAEPTLASEIAKRLETKTKQPKERIVRYYLPLLIKEKLIIKA